MAGKVRISNALNEGILGPDDYTPVMFNRGFADRSIGDEFFRTGRNSGLDLIENPDGMLPDEMSDDDIEDLGYDYDGGDSDMEDDSMDDDGYSYHSSVRNQLRKMEDRLQGIEVMLDKLFGSNGTTYNPISNLEDELNIEDELETEDELDME